ncbi:hypothetical protein PRIPAC_96034 [Pristionchus pacificus]|uniref:Uncharacterized protein n=1 Tax=Pristionchus pacificus TaxID=54126 RepID=A0A2A6BCY0_PRIPA|nr:hypothetical protein PRIPAC_96034 [Pristionchus pacificus]|eukprot:PDM63728.1 hypothetical protein PRIPAC_49701 [Pristionchus pacificus]
MPLREWTSNHKEVHKAITDSPGEAVTSFLGIRWNVDSDQLILKTTGFSGKEMIKATVLSETMSTYDPMGWAAPALLPARRFQKKITDCDWHSALSAEQQEEWSAIMSDLADRTIIINRYTPVSTEAELHVFSDASGAIGYGAAVYLRSKEEEGYRTVLLMAKSKNTAGWILRFARRMMGEKKSASAWLQPHFQESEMKILTAWEREIAGRLLISEANKEYPPQEDVIRNFGLENDGETWRACTSGATAEDTMAGFALPRFERYWFKSDNTRVLVEANETRVELQATLRKWKLTPVADLETCSMYREVKFHLKADLSMVAILGKDKLENARQSIPVIVKNILSLALISYEYIVIALGTIIVIIFIVAKWGSKSKAE